ncbi:unnamed protein product [Polarella glacialis]|uniref:Adenosylmethionine decarboxylase n=1 Tax=Polarella glacialis TaxID=89957 RepID=A0A813ET21_POLGL|nr:unnamed protein product [Polarella glacialis]
MARCICLIYAPLFLILTTHSHATRDVDGTCDVRGSSVLQVTSKRGNLSMQAEDIAPFEGREKTVTLCFRLSKMKVQSLRLIPQDSWSKVLEHAKCMILSSVQSGPAELLPHPDKPEKMMSTGKITGYLLSESSLFVSDDTITLKTCGTTTPLLALEPILDMVIPNWRGKSPHKFLKYASFIRLGYMFPDKQIAPHTSWDTEVEYLNKYFEGDDVILGTENTSTYHVYVANYLAKGQLLDSAISTQVALGHLSPEESMKVFVGTLAEDKTPLKTAWKDMHCDATRSSTSDPTIDEFFFEPIGYSSNAVFDERFTTIHATPQPSSSYMSVETSAPLTKDCKRNFVNAALGMCEAGTFSMTEFALSPVFLGQGTPPVIPGFTVAKTSQWLSDNFACALHHYVRESL